MFFVFLFREISKLEFHFGTKMKKEDDLCLINDFIL